MVNSKRLTLLHVEKEDAFLLCPSLKHLSFRQGAYCRTAVGHIHLFEAVGKDVGCELWTIEGVKLLKRGRPGTTDSLVHADDHFEIWAFGCEAQEFWNV